MHCSTVSKRASGVKIIPCAWHFQPDEVWSRVNSCSLALSLSFSEYIDWYFDKSICGRSDAIMAMDRGIFPRVWMNTLRLVLCLSWTYNLKGFFKSGSPKPKAETRFVFIVSKAFRHHVIQVGAQNPVPLKPQRRVLLQVQSEVFKSDRLLPFPETFSAVHESCPAIAYFLSGKRLHCPWERTKPRYVNCCLHTWAFFWENLYPQFQIIQGSYGIL